MITQFLIFSFGLILILCKEEKEMNPSYRVTKLDPVLKCMICPLDGSFCCPEGCNICSFGKKRNCWCEDPSSDSLVKKEPLEKVVKNKDNNHTSRTLDDILRKISKIPKKTAAVAAAQDINVLEAVHEAKKMGIADSILVGDKEKIFQICKDLNIDPQEFEIIDEKDLKKAALKAAKLVHDGKADLLMKGLVDTKHFLKAILNKEVGLRTGKPLSHSCVFEVEGIDRLLFISDAAFIPYPTVDEKKVMIEYTVQIANACGVFNPKVAPLAAVEVVNPKMQATLDGAELKKMNEEGIIKNCIVDGPLSLDLAIDPEAAKHKGATNRKIVGDADILIFPDIHAGNILYKALVRLTQMKNGCVLTGVKSPVVLTSRSDSFQTKIHSIALSAILAEEMSKKN